MADIGSIVGSFTVGQIAEHVSFGWSFVIYGVVLIIVAFEWVRASETRMRPNPEPAPMRALGPTPVGRCPDLRL
ncbi:MAG: hypothetical protein QOE41_1169 [Mycobacterium sp.]|jgi:ACDE family multidrug resistance protein|nr:pbuE [Mycobacterium sp.]MDT5131858.1 hypothetical protein [Mycobacterium sp.]